MVLAGWWWWQGRPREVTRAPAAVVSGQPVAEKVTASPSPAVREVVVHVVGEVVRPGLVRLPAGSRVADAVGAAGGLRPGGHLGGANLARVLVDGEQLVIGAGALPGRTTTDPDTVPGRTTTGPGTGAANAPLDLNAATTAQLEELPGIGPVLAGRIVAWREEHGAFTAVTELQEVSGVGDKVFAAIERLVRV
ncbi:MAG: ComEA family DNA-binding protein [Actinomycetota bacterium]|nr:MAG: ComEA family DNA-binding protein [Actinomycetota bacterium]